MDKGGNSRHPDTGLREHLKQLGNLNVDHFIKCGLTLETVNIMPLFASAATFTCGGGF